MLGHFRATLINIGAALLCLCLAPFRNLKLDQPTPESSQKPDVLLVHGYLHNETPWRFYWRHLKKAGLGTINVLCYRSIRWDIPKNSTLIKQRVDQIARETGREVTVLIGDSQGGLECLEYALEYAPKDRTTYVITLGSPLHGTKMTRIALGPSVRQMEIDSDYLKSLHDRLKKASHLRILSLAGTSDWIIQPYPRPSSPNIPLPPMSKLNILAT